MPNGTQFNKVKFNTRQLKKAAIKLQMSNPATKDRPVLLKDLNIAIYGK